MNDESKSLWRSALCEKIGAARELLDAAADLNLNADNGAFARQLLIDAVRAIERAEEQSQTADGGDLQEMVLSAQAMTLGAQHLPNTNPALPLIMERAFALLDEAFDLGDSARH